MPLSNSSSDPAPLPSLHILLVDDELCVRHIFGELLRSDGHSVGVAASGQEALDKFRDQPWDVVLTDRAMPGMDGEELARRLKATEPGLPVILITGLAPKVYDASAIDAVLTKPFTRQEIYGAISQCLAGRDAAGGRERKAA